MGPDNHTTQYLMAHTIILRFYSPSIHMHIFATCTRHFDRREELVAVLTQSDLVRAVFWHLLVPSLFNNIIYLPQLL